MLVENALDDVHRQRDGQKLVDDVNALFSGDGEDGGEWVDGETGEKSELKRGVIAPFVFDGACREFLKKEAEIGNPVTSDSEEDIFDYVPPQKTNQIYTLKAVVEMQVDLLEKEEPGCFDDPDWTFADLYVKSGYYLTLIAKRLYNSKAIKAAYL